MGSEAHMISPFRQSADTEGDIMKQSRRTRIVFRLPDRKGK